MTTLARKNRIHVDAEEEKFTLRSEVSALFLLALGVFYYLCILSYSPLDPAFFTSSGQDQIANLGGLVGSYLSGFFFAIFGGASYFIGAYFIINALLIFLKKRTKPKLIDFIVYLICSTFLAVFLQLRWGQLDFGVQNVSAGGAIGRLLGEIGATYLGSLGVYLFVIFGGILTFVLATRLSLIETLNTSTIVLGKGMGSLGQRFILYAVRTQKFFLRKWQEYKVIRALKKLEKENLITNEDESVKINLQKKNSTKPMRDMKLIVEDKVDVLDQVLNRTPTGEPTIRERKDKKIIKKTQDQMELQNIAEGYQLPPMAFLDYEDPKEVPVDPDALKISAKILEGKLKDFAIEGRVTEIHPGPVITMYEFQPAPGVKLSRIHSLSDDLSLAMGGRPVRIVAPLPNKAAVGIEIPNHSRETVWLKDIVSDDRFTKHESKLAFALGKDIEGIPYVADLQKMPHLMVAGSTGSGKSVSINTMVCSILYKARPDEVRMIMIDPKMIELSIYEGIPHLMLPVVTDPKKANLALKWAVREMERRYKYLSDVNARNIANYNAKIEKGEFVNKESDLALNEDPIVHVGKMPLIVIIIDEFADLMMVSSKEVEESVCRLAQKARAAGIHVILATQRPSVDVITGIIKANFPSRIAFRVSSKYDARTILDGVGAEHLLGMGDMLFVPPGGSKQTRLHGAYITESEIARIVKFLSDQAKPSYNEEILKPVEGSEMGAGENDEDMDEFYDMAVRQVVETKRVSISSIQRQFRIGYNRAARIVELMERQGVVSTANGQGQRQVLAGEI